MGPMTGSENRLGFYSRLSEDMLLNISFQAKGNTFKGDNSVKCFAFFWKDAYSKRKEFAP